MMATGYLAARSVAAASMSTASSASSRFGASWNAAGKRYDDAANLHRLGGYATLDLRASYAFAPGWSVQGRLANAFDRRYESVYYFNQPGRSYYLTLSYTPRS